jgi:aspartate/methionine/tyrosine aminotransferase
MDNPNKGLSSSYKAEQDNSNQKTSFSSSANNRMTFMMQQVPWMQRLAVSASQTTHRLWKQSSSWATTSATSSSWFTPSHHSFTTRTRSSSSLASSSSSSSSSSPSSSSHGGVEATSKTISRRGQAAVGLLPSYLADARAVEQYHPIDAPQGALQLGVAESQLVEDWLLPKINAAATATPFTADCIYYQPTAGRVSLRQTMADYMIQDLQLCKTDTTSSQLDLEGIIVGAGCNAVLENLCFCLANPGDAVMIPTPYYAAFEFDLVARAGLDVVPVTTLDYYSGDVSSLSKTIPIEAYYPTKAALDAAYERAPSPKILLLSHPHNPLGICYPPEVIQECLEWCRSKGIHLISDEIYAGSIHAGQEQANFSSILTVASSPSTSSSSSLGLGPYVHWVYALSKDFALSGLRVGVAYTENKDIQLPLQKLNDMCQISSQTQLLVQELLSSSTTDDSNQEGKEKWTTAFQRENHHRLRARSDQWQGLCDKLHVPYIPATAGLFVWLDLSEFLPISNADDTDDDQQRERALYLELTQSFGLLFTPGLSMRTERPGFFRCVFTAANEAEFELALQRFEQFVTTKRRNPSSSTS